MLQRLFVSFVLSRNSLLAASHCYRSLNLRGYKTAACLAVRSSPHAPNTPVIAQLLWLSVQARISYKIVCLCFSSINSSTPAYLPDISHLYPPARPLRASASTRLLKRPLYKYKMKGDRAFSHFGPSVWNSLPPHTGNAATITTFKSALRTHFFSLHH